jgi:hypothetical protein
LKKLTAAALPSRREGNDYLSSLHFGRKIRSSATPTLRAASGLGEHIRHGGKLNFSATELNFMAVLW